MNETILNKLKESRTNVEIRFNELNETAIITKKDFFNVVFNYFENMSKVMVNKTLKSDTVFFQQLYKAIESAEYKAHEISRRNNYNMMVRNQKTGVYNG